MADDNFFEEDEPIEAIRAVLQRPPDAVTAAPRARNAWVTATYGIGQVYLDQGSVRETGNRGATALSVAS